MKIKLHPLANLEVQDRSISMKIKPSDKDYPLLMNLKRHITEFGTFQKHGPKPLKIVDVVWLINFLME